MKKNSKPALYDYMMEHLKQKLIMDKLINKERRKKLNKRSKGDEKK